MTGTKATAQLTPRKVFRDEKRLYYVIEASHNDKNEVVWTIMSKGYEHSTSAFAKLGRLYQKELLGQ